MRARSWFAAAVLTLGLGALSAAHAAPVAVTIAEAHAAQSLPGEHPAVPMECRPKGAGCKVMNGKNPEPDNNLCCSGHCNWDNGSQAYLCD
jgi:hypothetical protein